MGFHEVRFPAALSFGSIGGPERRTEIVTLANGFEERNTPWAHSRRRYDAGVGVRSLDDLQLLIAFFEGRSGQLHGFRWKDWTDFKSCAPSLEVSATDQILGEGDGVATEFQLCRRYLSGGSEYVRPIRKPVAGTVRMAVDGAVQSSNSAWSVDSTTGIVTFATAPAIGASVTAGFEFDVPVRFDTESIRISAVGFEAGEIPDVPVVEVRV
ncbi:phage distal tail protein, Rcc01695 family [Tropicimonas aquimaris]|uniref:TIGR02217 family protein n=1 Tax=Tropicimonas aquimaris TaxID=914152 RepID=A0ABW3INZ6_9RHOB